MPPLAAGAHEVEEAIQQLSHVRGPRPPTGLGGRNERLQQAELVIRQCLAGAKVPNQRAISRRPHGGLQAGNRLQRRPIGQDQPVKPAPSPLCKRALSATPPSLYISNSRWSLRYRIPKTCGSWRRRTLIRWRKPKLASHVSARLRRKDKTRTRPVTTLRPTVDETIYERFSYLDDARPPDATLDRVLGVIDLSYEDRDFSNYGWLYSGLSLITWAERNPDEFAQYCIEHDIPVRCWRFMRGDPRVVEPEPHCGFQILVPRAVVEVWICHGLVRPSLPARRHSPDKPSGTPSRSSRVGMASAGWPRNTSRLVAKQREPTRGQKAAETRRRNLSERPAAERNVREEAERKERERVAREHEEQHLGLLDRALISACAEHRWLNYTYAEPLSRPGRDRRANRREPTGQCTPETRTTAGCSRGRMKANQRCLITNTTTTIEASKTTIPIATDQP